MVAGTTFVYEKVVSNVSALSTVSRGRGTCNTFICTKVAAPLSSDGQPSTPTPGSYARRPSTPRFVCTMVAGTTFVYEKVVSNVSALSTVSRGRGACNTFICTKVVAHHFRPREGRQQHFRPIDGQPQYGRMPHSHLHESRGTRLSSTRRSSAALPSYRRSAVDTDTGFVCT